MSKIIRREVHVPKLDEGWHKAMVKEVVLEYGVETHFGIKDQATIYFLVTAEKVELRVRKTLSLNPKSGLCRLIEQITGKAPGLEYDLERLEGLPCELLITHKVMETGDIWENIEKARKVNSGKTGQQNPQELEPEEDPVPF